MELRRSEESTLGFRIQRWAKGSEHYPADLLALSQPPLELFAIGNRGALGDRRVSIVGTRNSTAYGERIARSLTRAFVRSGVTIVSGMARGIDGAAHRTALEEGGKTVAILGTGVDVPYPVGHRQLHRTIADRGLVLSENPVGAKAQLGSFPKRNRIIAALSPVTIVVEAGFKSGALNTASQALDLDRVVAAVPGPMDAEQSRGSNQLLRDGAAVIASVEDALALLGISPQKERPIPVMPDSERKVWDALDAGFIEIDQLPAKTALRMPECLAAVTSLEIMGLIECSSAGEIRRRV